jgi:hypothetical protein
MMKNLLVIICLLSMLLLFSVSAQADTIATIGLDSQGLTFFLAADNFIGELALGPISGITFGVYHFKDKDGDPFAGYPYIIVGMGQINEEISDEDHNSAFGFGAGLAWVLDNDFLRNDHLYMYIAGTYLCVGTSYEINDIEYDGGTGFIGKCKLSYNVIEHLNIYGAIYYVESNRLDYQETDYELGIEYLF